MRIDRVEVYYVILPLARPFRWGFADDEAIHSVLVRMVSEGRSGWGEATPFYAPLFSAETATSAFFLIGEVFAPHIVGAEIDSAEQLLANLCWFRGNPMAKAGLETAWWMLKAAHDEMPLHRLLGGKSHPVPAGADFGIQVSIDDLLEKIGAAVAHGYPRIKLKTRPGWDLEMLKVVRAAFPDLTMHIDCNACYTLEDLPLFKAMDNLELAMIEQPLHHTDLVEHAELQSKISTPVCLDESVKSVRDFDLALRLGSCRILNIKVGRVGGLSVAVKLHDMARDAGIPCWVGGMLESEIGAGINIELATLPNFTYPGDLFETSRFYRQALTQPSITQSSDCTFTPSSVPGTPYRPIRERLDLMTKHVTVVEN